MTVASLAMYPFAEARPAVEELWDSVRARLPFDAPRLEWGLEHLDACRSPDLLVAQTCGWPVATVLGDAVRVFGTFDHDLERAVGGTYRSVLVSRHDRPLAATLADPDLVVAANAADSLSGWVSLRVVGEAAGVRFERVRFTGVARCQRCRAPCRAGRRGQHRLGVVDLSGRSPAARRR